MYFQRYTSFFYTGQVKLSPDIHFRVGERRVVGAGRVYRVVILKNIFMRVFMFDDLFTCLRFKHSNSNLYVLANNCLISHLPVLVGSSVPLLKASI